jgi:hypothetical protein
MEENLLYNIREYSNVGIYLVTPVCMQFERTDSASPVSSMAAPRMDV